MTRKFLTPIILPANPAAAMEAATKQYVDAHTAPAYAGPRTDFPTCAKFGNTAAPNGHGLTVYPEGHLDLVVPTGQKASFYSQPSAGGAFTWIADISSERLQVGDMVMGKHPTQTVYAIWANSSSGVGDFWMMKAGASLYLNASNAGSVILRVNNTDRFSVDGNAYCLGGRFGANGNYGGSDWSVAPFLSTAGDGNPRIALHCGSYVPQLRSNPYEAGGLGAVNSNVTSHVPLFATAFTVVSSATIKKGIRVLRPEREHINVHPVDPDSDVVALPDIMALRPVAYRPKVGVLTADNTEEGDTWAGRSGRRERLGLIAEEVAEVVPSAVSHTNDGDCTGIDYAQITVALLDHVQELTRTIETLQYRITELENR